MTLAKEINAKLDEILLVRQTITELDSEINGEGRKLIDGELPILKDIRGKGVAELAQLEKELNKITNNGSRGKDLFTNPYYVNDMAQDRLIADEIRANKLQTEEAKQTKPKNN